MSFCVVFEADVPPHGTPGADHATLACRKDTLDRLAGENGLTPLNAFESYDPGDAAEFLDEEEMEELPEARWFDPAAGLAVVRALADHVRSHTGGVPDHVGLLDEMTGIEEELADAERAGVRFRFAIVP